MTLEERAVWVGDLDNFKGGNLASVQSRCTLYAALVNGTSARCLPPERAWKPSPPCLEISSVTHLAHQYSPSQPPLRPTTAYLTTADTFVATTRVILRQRHPGTPAFYSLQTQYAASDQDRLESQRLGDDRLPVCLREMSPGQPLRSDAEGGLWC